MAGGRGDFYDGALGPEEAEAGHVLDLDRLVRHRELRIVGLARAGHQEVRSDRIGALLVQSVVLTEPPIVRLGVGNEEGFPLAPGERGDAEVGRARDHAIAARARHQVELGVARHLTQ